jgi:hypothetical protein
MISKSMICASVTIFHLGCDDAVFAANLASPNYFRSTQRAWCAPFARNDFIAAQTSRE